MNHVASRFPLPALLIVVLCFWVASCGKSEPPPKTPPPLPAKKVDTKKSNDKETVFDGLISNKERARTETDKAMELSQKNLEEAMKKNTEGENP